MAAVPTRVWLRPPRWLPLLVGATTAFAVLLLWRELDRRETMQLQARADIASDAVVRAIQRQFFSIQQAVERVSTLSVTPLRNPYDLLGTLDRLIAATDGLDGLLLVDRRGLVWARAPRDSSAPPVPKEIRSAAASMLSSLTDSSGQGRALPDSTMRVRAVREGPWGMVLLRPVHFGNYGTAAVVALIDERALLRAFTADTGTGFAVRAFSGATELAGDAPVVNRPVHQRTLTFGDRVIRLTFTPNAGNARSALPTVVLALGLAIATLLGVVLWLARSTYEAASSVGMTRMQRAIERATDGVWELDLVSDRVYRSSALLRSLGLDPDDGSGSASAWNARIHAADAARVAETLTRHLNGSTDSFECEYRLQAANGEWHTIVDRGRVIDRALDGRPRRMLGISADVTERSRAQAAREESERRFRAMFESAHQLQLLLDGEGRILEANLAVATRAGTSVEELQRSTFAQLAWWRPEDAVLVQERITRAAEGQANRFEVDLPDDRGRVLHIDFSLKPIRDETHRVVQVLAEGRDLTERKRAEVSLREISALTTMGQLAARIAHDINNPLAGIQNAFLLVRGAIPNDHPHHSFVGAIEREIARIAAVTRQLYETYRPDEHAKTSASVILAVGDAVSFLEQVNRARQVRIETDLSRAPSVVPVPDALLRQALYNLVQNALDVSPPGGTIGVTAALEGAWCVIHVTDQGPGIPENLQTRIFDPFFTTKDRSVKTGGMGIGLSLVHQSVTAVGGSIEVCNRTGGGSEFVVRLPMTPIDTGVLR